MVSTLVACWGHLAQRPLVGLLLDNSSTAATVAAYSPEDLNFLPRLDEPCGVDGLCGGVSDAVCAWCTGSAYPGFAAWTGSAN